LEGREQRHSAGIGEVIEGHDLTNSNFDIRFGKDTLVDDGHLCSFMLGKEDVATLTHAVYNHYWYQMYMDDLPIWGMLGEVVAHEKEKADTDTDNTESEADAEDEEVGTAYLYSHRHLSISYNEDRIIEVNLTSREPIRIETGALVVFKYSVEWKETDARFEDRFNRYLDYSFFEHQIHWFSIVNSFMMVIFLCGLVALILLRTLRNDYAKYTRVDEDEELGDDGSSIGDDSGWKMVHSDAFRRPSYLPFFTALLGTGYQLVFLAISVITLCICGSLYMERGAVMHTAVICYALTTFISGFFAGGFYKSQFQGYPSPRWISTMVLSALLLPSIIGTVFFGLNVVSVSYGTVHAMPVATIAKIAGLCLLVAFPLHVLGTILGRQWNAKVEVPCPPKKFPRPIPPKRWYQSHAIIILLTGLLPFGSIFIEMYFILTSFWNYKFYYVYGFMLLVFCILSIVTVCVSIVMTYFLLNSEDWRWCWLAFLSSGSTGGYVFIYSIYYFVYKTNMSGTLQTLFYFGYMAVIAFCLSLMTGAIGYYGANKFVHRIYRNIKID
jgi:transmembrane 9 superfamily protein 3